MQVYCRHQQAEINDGFVEIQNVAAIQQFGEERPQTQGM